MRGEAARLPQSLLVCEPGTWAAAYEEECTRLGAACPADGFSELSGVVRYVRAGAQGIGSRADPSGDLAAITEAAAPEAPVLEPRDPPIRTP